MKSSKRRLGKCLMIYFVYTCVVILTSVYLGFHCTDIFIRDAQRFGLAERRVKQLRRNVNLVSPSQLAPGLNVNNSSLQHKNNQGRQNLSKQGKFKVEINEVMAKSKEGVSLDKQHERVSDEGAKLQYDINSSANYTSLNIEYLMEEYDQLVDRMEYSVGNLVSRKNVLKSISQSVNKQKRSLLFRTRIENEKAQALRGDPLNTLPEYKNPCWEARLPNDITTMYEGNTYKTMHTEKYFSMLVNKLQYLAKLGATYRIRCLPYFFILGVTKSGTTDLYRLLNKHTEMAHPITKEPMYWNRFRVGGYGKHTFLQQYVDLFDSLGIAHLSNKILQSETKETRRQIIVDSSPSYFWEFFGWTSIPINHSMNRSQGPAYTNAHSLLAVNPGFKFVLLFRNPTDRVYSQYLMWRLGSPTTPDDFHNEIIHHLKYLVKCLKENLMRACGYKYFTGKVGRYIAASIYYLYLRDWTELFPLKQFFIIKSEEYFHSREEIIPNLLDFLGMSKNDTLFNSWVNVFPPQNSKKIRVERTSLPMRKDTRKLLNRFFEPFNKKLANYLGDTKWNWAEN